MSDLRQRRLDKIGFIFHYLNLLPFLDGSDNVAVVLDLAGFSAAMARGCAIELLDYLEVGHRSMLYPSIFPAAKRNGWRIARLPTDRASFLPMSRPRRSIRHVPGLDDERAATSSSIRGSSARSKSPSDDIENFRS